MYKHYKRAPWAHRAAPWTRARKVFDRLIPRVAPGKHHTIWDA